MYATSPVNSTFVNNLLASKIANEVPFATTFGSSRNFGTGYGYPTIGNVETGLYNNNNLSGARFGTGFGANVNYDNCPFFNYAKRFNAGENTWGGDFNKTFGGSFESFLTSQWFSLPIQVRWELTHSNGWQNWLQYQYFQWQKYNNYTNNYDIYNLNNAAFRPSSSIEYYTLTNPIRYLDAAGNRTLYLAFELKGYKPEEVTVTLNKAERAIIVEATHEVKDGKEHHVSRKFYRKFVLPQSLAKIDLTKIELKSHFGADGVLVIECVLPKMSEEELAKYPIAHEQSYGPWSTGCYGNNNYFGNNYFGGNNWNNWNRAGCTHQTGIYNNVTPVTVKTA